MISWAAVTSLTLALLSLAYAKNGGIGKLSEEENIWLQKRCGRYVPDEEESKVLHGQQTVYTSAPWVALLSLDFGVGYILQCSGSLISPRHVLTAGHCLVPVDISCENGIGRPGDYENRPSDFVVQLHVNCVRSDCANTTTIDRRVTRAFHPYSMTQDACYQHEMNDVGDIAVFELDENVPYAAGTYPACLSKRRITLDDKLRQFGYGKDPSETEAVRYQGILKTYDTVATRCDFRVAPDGACALSNETRMSCRGDSGSGMTLIDSHRHEIVAILTGGKDCNKVLDELASGEEFQYKDTLVDVHHHKEWICNATGVCGSDVKIETKSNTSGLYIEVPKPT